MTPNQALPSPRRKSDPEHFRDGLSAVLRADPDDVAATRPRTILGASVRGLALEFARGKTAAIRLVLSRLDDGGDAAENKTETCLDSQGIMRGAEPPQGVRKAEPQWEWNAAGEWAPSRRVELKSAAPAPQWPMNTPPTEEENAAVERKMQMLVAVRLAEIEAEKRAAEAEAEKTGGAEREAAESPSPPPAPDGAISGSSPNALPLSGRDDDRPPDRPISGRFESPPPGSGSFAPQAPPPPPQRFTIRIAGREV
jgi:hypothetical protein